MAGALAEVIDFLIEKATREYIRLGVVPTDTYIALNNAGADADEIIDAIEEAN